MFIQMSTSRHELSGHGGGAVFSLGKVEHFLISEGYIIHILWMLTACKSHPSCKVSRWKHAALKDNSKDG